MLGCDRGVLDCWLRRAEEKHSMDLSVQKPFIKVVAIQYCADQGPGFSGPAAAEPADKKPASPAKSKQQKKDKVCGFESLTCCSLTAPHPFPPSSPLTPTCPTHTYTRRHAPAHVEMPPAIAYVSCSSPEHICGLQQMHSSSSVPGAAGHHMMAPDPNEDVQAQPHVSLLIVSGTHVCISLVCAVGLNLC